MEITVSVVAPMIIPCYHIIILDSVGPHKMVAEVSLFLNSSLTYIFFEWTLLSDRGSPGASLSFETKSIYDIYIRLQQ